MFDFAGEGVAALGAAALIDVTFGEAIFVGDGDFWTGFSSTVRSEYRDGRDDFLFGRASATSVAPISWTSCLRKFSLSFLTGFGGSSTGGGLLRFDDTWMVELAGDSSSVFDFDRSDGISAEGEVLGASTRIVERAGDTSSGCALERRDGISLLYG